MKLIVLVITLNSGFEVGAILSSCCDEFQKVLVN